MKAECFQKPCILICIDYFLPGYKSGGPQRSILNLISALKDEFDFYIVCRDRDMGDTQPYLGISPYTWIALEGCKVMYYTSFNPLRFARVVRGPYHAVLLNSFFAQSSYFALILCVCLRLSKRVLLAPRGELFNRPLAIKSLKKSVFIRFVKTFQIYRRFEWVATDESERLAVLKQFPRSSNIRIASDIPALSYTSLLPLAKYPKTLRLVFLSRVSPIKNLLFALETLTQVPEEYNLVFDIYGTIEDAPFWEKCRRKMKECHNVQVTYQGAVHPDEVFHTLSRYHAFFLPTLSENFGHAIFEALAAGAITLISDQTPWHGLEDAQAGWDLPLTSPHSFLEKILYLAEASQETIDFMRQNALQYARARFESSPALAQSRQLLLGKG